MTIDTSAADSIGQTRTNLGVRPLDAIPRWKAFMRSFHPLCVIANRSLRGPYSRQEFIDATCHIQRRAQKRNRIQDKSVGLWRMEKLGFSYCRHGHNTLNDAAIPAEVQPISHVGLGIAATEGARFSSDKIIEMIESRAHPDFRLFPYESAGCLWALHANKWFQIAFRFVSNTRTPPSQLPIWREFVGGFSPDVQWLVSHGCGRALYFKECDIGRAIRTAERLESLDTRAAVQGVAFAYAMLNHADLYRVLEVDSDLRNQEFAQTFRHGLIYALAFWEWAFAGFLDGLSPRSERQAELIAHARELSADRQTGRLAAFRVT